MYGAERCVWRAPSVHRSGLRRIVGSSLTDVPVTVAAQSRWAGCTPCSAGAIHAGLPHTLVLVRVSFRSLGVAARRPPLPDPCRPVGHCAGACREAGTHGRACLCSLCAWTRARQRGHGQQCCPMLVFAVACLALRCRRPLASRHNGFAKQSKGSVAAVCREHLRTRFEARNLKGLLFLPPFGYRIVCNPIGRSLGPAARSLPSLRCAEAPRPPPPTKTTHTHTPGRKGG